jgi:hypothetical protein
MGPPGRRAEIGMDEHEVLAFLDEERVMTCATLGPRGHPHLMPLWYVVRGETLWAWTFSKSQKVRNLERDRRATVQVEAGGGEYGQLRGVMFETEVVLHREEREVASLGLEIARRYGGGSIDDQTRAAVEQQAPKRVGLEFVELRRATWDHRKLHSPA